MVKFLVGMCKVLDLILALKKKRFSNIILFLIFIIYFMFSSFSFSLVYYFNSNLFKASKILLIYVGRGTHVGRIQEDNLPKLFLLTL